MNDPAQVKDGSIFFTDGYVVSKEVVLVAAKLNAIADQYFSRLYCLTHGRWLRADVKDSVHSATFDSDAGQGLWLGLDGSVIETLPSSGRSDFKIPDTRRYGNLNRVKCISGDFYICGYGGQVYKRKDNAWNHHDVGLLIPKPDAMSVDLLDIDGNGPDDLYAVGTGGAMWHFDGAQWRALSSPTNVHLTGVRCVSSTEVYICGFRGVLMKGNQDGWNVLSPGSILSNFYDVEFFREELYVSAMKGIWTLKGASLEPMEVLPDNEPKLTFHRLHSNGEVLWSFGTDHLAYFDGTDWHYVRHPDNLE
ncbi:beta propeller repeat protein [Caballeronia telluris]|uniref:FG-GAP repeat protein n=1 Tax=Caballeronia telluris TaxID=326475 RepID=A0A158FVS6_9BURK|nr:hypothetical protein [Caballeronia telluris]SAL23721.1 hypothetical protein AWB66_01279 [Caballeronia telluris]